MRRAAAIAVGALALFGAAADAAKPADSREGGAQRSILLVSIDTLRADHLTWYGYERETTPFMSRLAKESVVFDLAESTSSWTVPAVVSMLTGLAPEVHGVERAVSERPSSSDEARLPAIPASATTMTEVMSANGYRTYGIVANALLRPDLGFERGFDRFRMLPFARADQVQRVLAEWEAEIFGADDSPVFLWIHLVEPHTPYDPHPWMQKYLPPDATPAATLPLLEQALASWPNVPEALLSQPAQHLLTISALYDAEIEAADRAIEQVFTSYPDLREFLLVVTSDHGEEFLEHGRVGHGLNLHETTTRIPLLIREPSLAAHRVSRPVSLGSVPATLLRWAGLGVDGLSPHAARTSLLDFEAPAEPVTAALVPLDRPGGRIRSWYGRRLKILEDADQSEPVGYDLARDPAEQRRIRISTDDLDLQALERHRERLPSALAPSSVEISTDVLDQLRALGYLP